MGKRSYFTMSSEDKRQMMLDLAQVISQYGTEGAKMKDILEDDIIIGNYSKIKAPYLMKKVQVDLSKILGKITVGDRASTKYVIDNLDVAVQLINNYYDTKMTESELWRLRRDICEYIIKKPGVVNKDICEEFQVEDEFIDKMNSELVKYNLGIDFYKSIGRGVKMRINEPEKTIGTINAIISSLKSKDVQERKVPTNGSLIEIDQKTRNEVQERLIRIIYQKDGMMEDEICREYEKLYGNRIMYPTIRSMMSNVKSVSHSKNGNYWIKDITEALNSVDPRLGTVQFEIVSKFQINTDEEIQLSREFDGLYIYKVKYLNDDKVFMKILNLMIKGVSIDPEITDKVMSVIENNMKYGKRFLI